MIEIVTYEKYSAERSKTQIPAQSGVSAAVAEIIADVVKRGDAAVREYTEKFDGCALERFEAAQEEIDTAFKSVDTGFIEVMERAAENIREFHRRQVRQGFLITPCEGVVLGQRVHPLTRAGLYIPGGTASYPSSVLMNCIPAEIAGVGEIIITTPPLRDGSVNPKILAAAKIAGADRVFKVGGAQAVAALAYGTDTIPKVDKITGPGNDYVAEAKRQVFGVVGIDMIAGPSDILVIADEKADPALVAADMLSQCEHGTSSQAILITDSRFLAKAVSAELEKQLPLLPRCDIAREAIDNYGKIIAVDTIECAFEAANEIAPEHLEIFLENPFEYLSRVKNAGSVFLGGNTPEALGDYYAGPNHTLPTSGTARFSSPLSVEDFIKRSSFTYYSKDALRAAAGDIAVFAEKEGLYAHAQSVLKRVL